MEWRAQIDQLWLHSDYKEDEGENVEIQQRGNKSEDKRRMTALNGGEGSE